MMIDRDRCQKAYERARDDLLAERCDAGHWLGELASSALSTATAVSALSLVADNSRDTRQDVETVRKLVHAGLDYLVKFQNPDGGWGDTDKSLSNIATTMLVRAAIHIAGQAEAQADQLALADRYIESQGGLAGLRRRYGRDKTFAVPILTNCALAGQVSWKEVAPLPFEAACFPHGFYRFLQLPVVSYALPALVAIGQARYFHRKPWNPIMRLVRRWAVRPSLKKLLRMQPDSGGFLEATPLTSFVVMSLASIGQADHPVVKRGVEFLIRSVRDDGSWPIDTDLATWVTTLSINALAEGGEDVGRLDCLEWLLSCQHREIHPFTNADPGGWGWTDLSGAVPDADDTPGALLALAHIRRTATEEDRERIDTQAAEAIRWLLDLQNRDGGWPTFCRGWGKLPFDRSGVDLTAHVLRALAAWSDLRDDSEGGATAGLSSSAKRNVGHDTAGQASSGTRRSPRQAAAIESGFAFLKKQQRADGSWVPLWFGNQYDPTEENPIYGTARVLLAYAPDAKLEEPARRGLDWLTAEQNPDGGWGGSPGDPERNQPAVSGVEETAVAVSALAAMASTNQDVPAAADQQGTPLARGLRWLIDAIEQGRHQESLPIGFYFAKLWYYEKVYPQVFTVEALARTIRHKSQVVA